MGNSFPHINRPTKKGADEPSQDDLNFSTQVADRDNSDKDLDVNRAIEVGNPLSASSGLSSPAQLRASMDRTFCTPTSPHREWRFQGNGYI